jgi:hypothetical protein
MIEWLYGQDPELVMWAEQRLSGQHFRPDVQTIGLALNGRLRCVVGYDTFSPTNCYIAVASDDQWGWFTRELRIRALAFPFLQCGLKRITALISVRNHRSTRFISGFDNFKREGRAREAGPHGEDLILWGLLRRECRHLPYMPAQAIAV